MTEYEKKLRLYSNLTRWTCAHPNENAMVYRAFRFWCAKLIGLHSIWRAQGATLPRWWPANQ